MCCKTIRAKKNRRVGADAADSNSPVFSRNVLPGVPKSSLFLASQRVPIKTNDNWLQRLKSLLFLPLVIRPRERVPLLFLRPHTKPSRELPRNDFPIRQVACQLCGAAY